MADHSWTILRVIQWTTDYFKEKNVEEPRASAEILLAQVLKLKRIQLYLNYDKPLHTEELSRYKDYIKQRVAGKPVQYITGTQEFWSIPLRLTSAVLIPRPESELLVERGVQAVSETYRPLILEIGTGSGAISIALAKEIESAFIVGTDISCQALSVAKQNRDRAGVSERLSYIQCDLLKCMRPKNHFHLIVSNPPYVSEEEYENLPTSIKSFEPQKALLAGKEGLDILKPLIHQAHNYLLPGGYLLLEIGAGQGDAVLAITRDLGVYREISIIKDYAGKNRVLSAQKQ